MKDSILSHLSWGSNCTKFIQSQIGYEFIKTHYIMKLSGPAQGLLGVHLHIHCMLRMEINLFLNILTA